LRPVHRGASAGFRSGPDRTLLDRDAGVPRRHGGQRAQHPVQSRRRGGQPAGRLCGDRPRRECFGRRPDQPTGERGQLHAGRGRGKAYWTRRIKALGFGAYDFTGINGYTLGPDGSGTAELARLALGAGGKALVGSEINAAEPGAYEIYFGVQMTPVSGTGVFLNPQKVLNAAGFGPAGNPIAPGEFLALQGTGLARS